MQQRSTYLRSFALITVYVNNIWNVTNGPLVSCNQSREKFVFRIIWNCMLGELTLVKGVSTRIAKLVALIIKSSLKLHVPAGFFVELCLWHQLEQTMYQGSCTMSIFRNSRKDAIRSCPDQLSVGICVGTDITTMKTRICSTISCF